MNTTPNPTGPELNAKEFADGAHGRADVDLYETLGAICEDVIDVITNELTQARVDPDTITRATDVARAHIAEHYTSSPT